jgi:hypothetical protein
LGIAPLSGRAPTLEIAPRMLPADIFESFATLDAKAIEGRKACFV